MGRKKHTEESKLKIGKANSIKQQGSNNSNYGNCWIYNIDLKENKLIKKLNKSERPDKVLFVITTDGQENNSKEYVQEQIKKLIKKQEKSGWKFIYTAAGQDAFTAGTGIGISAGNTLTFTNNLSGYDDFNMTLDSAVTSYRSTNTTDSGFLNMSDTLMSDAVADADKTDNSDKDSE